MKITFLGATHEVTGSCTYLEVNGHKLLVDCGMEQGVNVFVNEDIPVPPSEIECVLLTHAHIDHSGKLPWLYKYGFRGSVYATEATCNLCNIMLRDSAHIQEFEAEWQNRKAQRAGKSGYEPLYTMADAEGVIRKLRPVPYGERIQVLDGVDIAFTDVGHLLGSGSIEVWMREGDVEKKMVFSGDIGNHDRPILRDPQPTLEADYVMIESTYGNRYHEKHEEEQDYVRQLADVIQRTLDRGGNVVIPSFAVGRTQEILYFIRQIKEDGLVRGHDGFKVYVDSPLANEATSVFVQSDRNYFDDNMRALLDAGKNPLFFPGLEISVTSDESKAINFDMSPKVILSASGMCEAGRIRHHLKHNLWRKESTILFVGYQAVGTLGRSIYEGTKQVKLFGEEIGVSAQIDTLAGISGHADKEGLLKWINSFEKKPSLVFVNHGEDESCKSFAECLEKENGFRAVAPYSGTIYDLAAGECVKETEGVLIPKESKPSGDGMRTEGFFGNLAAAGRRLTGLISKWRERPNKEIKRFTKDVEDLCDKWEKEL
ncbi:MBL fold metallo-hydrolase [Cuneatibacter sp. NSJ-177]|uniref:MBL fold metallo-hydrolase RNA specificity domain-containing protein n=1 Tax=Cuneatibacter sp. NSJ-177 TaxID=2931401 RepID=UPI001FD0380F|nr:MBL fold metallo-hydrolase [Cuneatibacter sp. NSJ-177]MCJ7834322.1 MBL fold metallo-hydrolase [Cuneatibacter sp. NSJ-177]